MITKVDLGGGVFHSARFSKRVLAQIEEFVEGGPVLDPFAGTGLIHELPYETMGIEIEPEWANLHPDTIIGDAINLPFRDESIPTIATSPTYGNRLADSHNAQDGSTRYTYTHDLGHKLHPNNSGHMQWGDAYRTMHEQVWIECLRVLMQDGVFILNIKDHYRQGKHQEVAKWHMNTLASLGFRMEQMETVSARGLRVGSNRELRTVFEHVIKFRRD